jgi:hypothetical protein
MKTLKTFVDRRTFLEGTASFAVAAVCGGRVAIATHNDDALLHDLSRRWGLKVAERGGKRGKKRAIIAVARKLAVLLHHLWISCEEYEPLHNTRKRRLAAA